MSRVVSSAFGILLGMGIACLLSGRPAHALDSPHAVISMVQVGDSLSANNEVIEIYNNDSQPVEATNWCVYYASATSTTNGTKLACLLPTDALDHLFIPAHGSVSFASKQYAFAVPTIIPDFSFSSTLSGTAGHVRLLDSNGALVDKVGWGTTAVSPEGLPAIVPTTDMVLVRKLTTLQYVDTNNNAADFSLIAKPLTLPNHQVYDAQDVCANIDGIQLVAPENFVIDGADNCVLPVIDICMNLDDVQADVPDGYTVDDYGNCSMIPAPLLITEALPNPDGSDTSNEFIELYNPTYKEVVLTPYVVKVGQHLETTIKFLHHETIPSGGYFVLKNDTYTFTLLNSSSNIALLTNDAQLIAQISVYSNPYDGFAWALIDGTWQYTNQPTPGRPNLLSFDSVDSDVANTGVALTPCAANQYRNPETGRCKLLTGQGSTLVPCKDNQYRSEETGRCRTIAAVAGPAPCPAGQERNVDTGRCRKIVLSTPPKANYAVLGASTSGNHSYVLWAVLGIMTLGLAYAIWEWHQEITKTFRKMTTIFTTRK